MGLDMELVANRRLSPMEEGQIDNVVRDALRTLGLADTNHTTTVHRVVGTLRSAYPIHCWFQDNARIGLERDGTNRYFLSRTQVAQLHDACARVLSDRSLAIALLPPYTEASVDADLDDRYFSHIQSAMHLTARALELPEAEWLFEYRYSA